jgi:outer membrane protein assembly factor BamE (lipoprotein component of BamABCDE complex)
MNRLRRFAVLCAAATLFGCSAISVSRLEPGKSSEADVRAAFGTPPKVYENPDGSRQLAFPTGPAGTQTHMAFLAPDGRLMRLEQVLTEEQFRRIENGRTSRDQLERLIGPPWRTIDFPNKRQVAWDYVFEDSWSYIVDFSVMLDERGLVAERASVRRERGRGHSGSN